MIKPLKGKDLVEYLEEHRDEYEDNGDALCVAAGYVRKSEGGENQCNLPAFIKELDEATDIENFVYDESDESN